MKRGVLVATLAVVVAGVAGASLLPSTSHGVESSARAPAPTVAPSVAPVAQGPVRRAPPQQALAPVAPPPAVQKASVEPRQAPVPLLVKPRPAVYVPTLDVSTDAPVAAPSTEAVPPTDASANESVARAAIEADGYKGVRVLRKGENGVWYAKALRGKTEVTLIVDAGGSVSAE